MQSTQKHQKTLVKTKQKPILTDLLDLLDGKLLALRIPSYYPQEQALIISEKLIEQDTYTCSPNLSPIDKLRLDLGEIWLAGACIENVHHRIMLAGIGRVFADDFELPPHQNVLPRDILDAPIYPTYPFSKLVTQLSANIYLRTPKFGGELEIWNLKPTIRQSDRNKEYHRRILPPADSVIKPQLGELILFDSARIHAVRACHGGPRVSMSMFIGYRDRHQPLTYWS